MDPYKILGVTPQTGDDDVKRAYRELARKYHPDNYVNNPLSDLAESRMKEINDAYDRIMSERSGKNGSGARQQTGGYQSGTGQTSGTTGGLYGQVRQAITAGNLSMAEELLQRCPQRDAQWHFLMGCVYQRKGWFDEAERSLTQACTMEPNNAEYRAALNSLNMTGNYGGYRPMASSNACDCCTQLCCLQCCWSLCCRGGC